MNNFLRRQPRGIVISPDKKIDIQPLEVEGTIVWGKKDNSRGRPCWITPSVFRHTKGFPYILLSTISSIPITLPGEPPVQKDRTKLSKAMGEQFAKQSVRADKGRGLTSRIVILTVLVSITILFLIVVMGTLAPDIVRNYF